MPYGDKKSYSFFKMKYNNSAFPFKSPLKEGTTGADEGVRTPNRAPGRNVDPVKNTGESAVKMKSSPTKLLDNLNLSLFSQSNTGQGKKYGTGGKSFDWRKNKTKTTTKLKNVGNQ